MNQLLSNPTRICGKCHQELPCEAFYVSQKVNTGIAIARNAVQKVVV